jgi:glycerol kinase
VRKLKQRLGADQLIELAGVPLSTYPSVGKLLWLLENEPKVKEAYEKGVLAFGTIDAWLVYKLNGGKHDVPCRTLRSLSADKKTRPQEEHLRV